MLVKRGFTLVEVLVSLVLMVLVAGIGLRLFLLQHWTGVAQGETAAVQAALRAGSLFLSSELRELGGAPGDPDILVFAPESLTYRAMRGIGFTCARAPGAILVDTAGFAGYRGIQTGRDSVLLHFEGRVDQSGDDRWIHLPLHSIGASSCAGRAALQLATTIDTTTFPLGQFADLAPIRTFEIMQVKLYQSGADSWLGARSVSAGEAIQPLTGPLTRNGLQLSYQDSLGGPPSTADQIRSIGITLRATSSIPLRAGGGFPTPARLVDSLITTVALRNW
jgi:prepilin-type N-terminal cleavage/methylation domain-containing protein